MATLHQIGIRASSRQVCLSFKVLFLKKIKKFQIFKKKNENEKKRMHLRSMNIRGQIFFFKRRIKQSQGTTSKVAIKVQVFRAEGKKIKNVLNMLIRVLEES